MKNGFTLIELLISVTAVSILLGISFAGYARLDQRQRLVSTGQTVKNIIRDAQSRAVNGEIDCAVCNCSLAGSSQSTGWYVDFSTRTLYGTCASTTFSSKSFGISSDIAITPHITPATKLLFRNFPPGTDQKATICLSDPNMSNTYYSVSVSTSGEVGDSGGLTGTCTP